MTTPPCLLMQSCPRQWIWAIWLRVLMVWPRQILRVSYLAQIMLRRRRTMEAWERLREPLTVLLATAHRWK